MRARRIYLAAAVMLPLAGCGQEATAPPPTVRPVLSVVAAPVSSETIGPYVGSIMPRYQTPLSFQTSGRIVARPVRLGDSVTKGELLASLDASVQQFALVSAEADLASAQSQYNNLSAAAERAKSLVATGASAQAQLDQATTAQETAAAQVSQANASLSRARNELGYASITAGFNGVVISTGAEVGQVVGAGQTVITIARPDVREAVFDLPESATPPSLGASWTVSVIGAPDETMTGTVREIVPLFNGATRSQTVRLALANPPDSFRLGTTVEVSHDKPTATSFPLPATAILDADGKMEVWIVDPKAMTVSSRPVTASAVRGGTVAVTDGLKAGDRVVVAGVHSLSPGQAVKLDGETP